MSPLKSATDSGDCGKRGQYSSHKYPEHLSTLQLVSQQSIICKATLLENQWMQSGIPEEKVGYASFQNVM